MYFSFFSLCFFLPFSLYFELSFLHSASISLRNSDLFLFFISKLLSVRSCSSSIHFLLSFILPLFLLFSSLLLFLFLSFSSLILEKVKERRLKEFCIQNKLKIVRIRIRGREKKGERREKKSESIIC